MERWIGLLTDHLLRRGENKSVAALDNEVRAWITAWNENHKRFAMTKSYEEFIDSLAR